MSDMFDSLEAEMAGLRRELEAVKAERDALEAHVERWRAAYVKLTNRVEFADNGEGCYVADGALMHEFDAISGDTPTTSLARLKAQWQAEVAEAMCIEIQPLSHRCASIMASKAGELRRQAEGE